MDIMSGKLWDDLHKDHDCKPAKCNCRCNCKTMLGCTTLLGGFCGRCHVKVVREGEGEHGEIMEPVI